MNHLCDIHKFPFQADSAGLYAREGGYASSGACIAMKARGLSLANHRTKPPTEILLKNSFLIITMTPEHVELCLERFPWINLPLRSFCPPVSDPFGSSVALYHQTASNLEMRIIEVLQELSMPI